MNIYWLNLCVLVFSLQIFDSWSQQTLQIVTFKKTTKWPYVTLEPIDENEYLGLNPWLTKETTVTTTTPRPTGSTYPNGPEVFQSDFDAGLNGFYYDSVGTEFNWTRWEGKCPHPFTGPEKDHTTGKGFYMYIDCSAPRVEGMRARLTTKELYSSYGCANVSFWYHAYGYHLASLTLKSAEKPFTDWADVWQISGPSQEQEWQHVSVIAPGMEFKLTFEGVVGESYQGDYAIDDVLVLPVACPQTTTPLNVSKDFQIDKKGSSSLADWAIALIVVATICVIAGLILVGYVIYKEKKTRREREMAEKAEEERRKQEMEEEGIIHTDRPYSTRVRSGMGDRPAGRMLNSAQRRMAPGYGNRPGSKIGSGYGRLDIPTSAISKRGHSPDSSVLNHQPNQDYGYDQESDINLSQAGDVQFSRADRIASARVRMASETTTNEPPPPQRLPSIFGGETPPASAAPGGRRPPSAAPSSQAVEPSNFRPETPHDQPSGKSERMGWFD